MELKMHGRWTRPATHYAREVIRFRDEIGNMRWAAPQDMMCEREILAKTGLTVLEHQRRTIVSVLELRALGAPVIPVLQGWARGEYLDHAEAYEAAGINLRAEPIVGVGSVCRRQNTFGASMLIQELAAEGLKLHGFGFKVTGLRSVGHLLASADSLAWSYNARRNPPRFECRGTHKNCANCFPFALEWREDLLAKLGASGVEVSSEVAVRRGSQLSLFES